jgi:cytochrome P450
MQRKKKRMNELPFADIPYTVPNPHWLIGHLHLFGASVIDGQRRLLVDYAGGDKFVSTCYMLNIPTFTTLDAGLMNRILLSTYERRGGSQHRRHFRKMFGEKTILMMNREEWKENRARIHRALHAYDLAQLQRLLTTAAVRVEDCLCHEVSLSPDRSLQLDALKFCRMASLDVFGLACMGHDFGCTKGLRLSEAPLLQRTLFLQEELTRRCFEERFSVFAQLYWLPSQTNRRHARDRQQFTRELYQIIKERRMHPPADDEPRLFIDTILDQVAAEDDDEELADFLKTVMIGGFDTTAIALCSTLYLLSKHPNYQRLCREEIRRVCDGVEEGKVPGFDSITDLPLTTACFFEALRLYPPATMTARSLVRPFHFELDGRQITLKEGTRIASPFYWINRFEHNFSRPHVFLPERWVQRKKGDGEWEKRTPTNDLGGDIPRGKESFNISFSAGARNCVGRSISMRMGPTMLALLLRKLDFELADSTYEIELERCGGNATPKGGVPLRVTLAT